VYTLPVVTTIPSGLLLAIPLFSLLPIALPAQDLQHAPTIRVQVDSVFVPVVVRDPSGRAVSNLAKDDFQLFDNGKLISISGFAIEKRAEIYSRKSPEPPNSAPDASRQPSNMQGVQSAPATQAADPLPTRFIVLVFDNLHLNVAELMQAQKAATSIFSGPMAQTDMAAVVSLTGSNSGLTHDAARLREAVSQIKLQQILRHDDHACPNIDYYQADLIQNKRSELALESAEADFVACAHVVGQSPSMVETFVRSAASQSLMHGESDMSATLANLREIVKKMGTLSGERTLILISPGFFAQTSSALAEKSQILDIAARCNVTISAIDARGLYTTTMDASEQGGSSARDLMTGERAQRHSDEMNFNEDVMSELAEGTGGKFFHNSNDLENGLQTLAASPEVVYLLAISLKSVKHDGSYHSLKVKVATRELKVQARRGYFAPVEKIAKKPKSS